VDSSYFIDHVIPAVAANMVSTTTKPIMALSRESVLGILKAEPTSGSFLSRFRAVAIF